MTIASALADLNTDIQNARTAITNKGGTVTVDGGSSQLATDIGTITTMNGTTISITPTTSAQSFTPSSPYNAFTNVSVSAVTYNIDPNIIASNIKSGVSILGVTGNVIELKGETKTINPSTSTQTITPSAGKNGITSATVNPVTSSIDANIQAGNIKKDVQILGVTGTFEGGITPTGTLSINANSTYDVTNYASAEVNVPNGNTAIWGATIEDIFPCTSVPNYCSGHDVVALSNKSANANYSAFASLFYRSPLKSFTYTGSETISTAYWGTWICRDALYLEGFKFPNTTTISAQYALESCCRGAGTNGSGIVLDFSNLTTTGNHSFRYGFASAKVKSINFDKLKSAGTYAFYQAFSSAYFGVEEVSFPVLTSVGGYCFHQAFSSVNPASSDNKIKKVSFDAITSITTQNAFYNVLNGNKDIEECSFANLTTVSGVTSLASMAGGVQNFKKANFKKLKTVSGNNCLRSMFAATPLFPETYCFESLETIGYYANFSSFASSSSLKNLFLPSLKSLTCTSSSASNAQFYSAALEKIYLPKWTTMTSTTGANNIFTNSGITEFHFGKENQSTIEALTGYSTLWGRGAGQATVYFDLINTITVGGVDYTRDGPDYEIDYDGGTSYYSWINGSTIVYTTNPYTPSIGDTVYTKSGTTYTASGTISAVA